MGVELLGPAQWECLVRELGGGMLAHGWDEEQGWTLVRIRALVIRLFLVEYTVQGVWKLMRRHGWSPQVPARRALERDDASVERWRSEVWETVKPPRRPGTPTSASRTRPGRDRGRRRDIRGRRADRHRRCGCVARTGDGFPLRDWSATRAANDRVWSTGCTCTGDARARRRASPGRTTAT
ncbi:winged helix-turn-helix domain-containing protein [Streptomyces sp. V4I8]|uniref:helix-turn-helix domain-containing protein n=1 Tax=Streptomyces sp. V4I8 TaxID=3156469 RepID=UPI003517F185